MHMLAEHGVADRFIFTGFREDVHRMITAMDIFVLSTHSEGFPLVVLEAMAQGKPVVATAVDGIPEMIQDGKTGLLYPHGDHARLAEQMFSLLNSDDRVAALGEAGRELVRQNFSTAMFATRMVDLYEGMINQRSRRKLFSSPQESANLKTLKRIGNEEL
jgi:glycosyltransferase involved in cell wall biosynthesis